MATSKRRRVEPITSFKVYPDDNRRLYFCTKVFKSNADMRAYGEGAQLGICRNTRGYCVGYTTIKVFANGRHRTTNYLGEILLLKRFLGSRIVAHECVHAAIRYLQRKGVSTAFEPDGSTYAPKEEEQLAYAVGDLSAQIHAHLFEAGITAPSTVKRKR